LAAAACASTGAGAGVECVEATLARPHSLRCTLPDWRSRACSRHDAHLLPPARPLPPQA
jgi:hypothetical protein